ncbi:helix-turn-helix domain-containing protein, partial [Clostridium beijerinckii]
FAKKISRISAGCGVSQTPIRIHKAKELLGSNKLKIYEIAEKVGYSDSKYFCKVFKESTGMSPKEYMKFY